MQAWAGPSTMREQFDRKVYAVSPTKLIYHILVNYIDHTEAQGTTSGVMALRRARGVCGVVGSYTIPVLCDEKLVIARIIISLITSVHT